jgi:formylglycine-generating enzyme required for sulfatase activity
MKTSRRIVTLVPVAVIALALSCSKDRRPGDAGVLPGVDGGIEGMEGGQAESGEADGENNFAQKDAGADDMAGKVTVPVPQGSFWMGCNQELDEKCRQDEHPYHEVVLDAFEVDRYEVTVGDYRACVSAGGCTEPDTGGSCNWDVATMDDHPVNCVDFSQAVAYCEWAKKRLPTEAEWEKAARGTEGQVYPWGNDSADCEHAVMNDGGNGCGTGKTMAVGSKPAGASPFGAMDMAGNVWEWVADWYDASYYQTSPASAPPGPQEGTFRVARGGSWYGGSVDDLRASRRNRLLPSFCNHDLGFRCAVTP